VDEGVAQHALPTWRRWLPGVSALVDNAIDFELRDHEAKTWRLADHLAHGPVLLVFYRGDW